MKKKPPPTKKKEAVPVAAVAKKKSAAVVPASARKKAAAAVSTSAKKKPAAVSASAKKKGAVPVAAVAKKKSAAVVPVAARKKAPSAKKKPAAAVSASAKKKPPPAAVSAAAKKKPPAAAAAPAAKKCASGGTAGRRPRKRARDGSCDADLFSNLPDDILHTIVSLLPTKDGARTQAIARRWRPLWRSLPLNIDADDLRTADPLRQGTRLPASSVISVISRILSDHPGPVRRFDFRISFISETIRRGYSKDAAEIEGWLHSPSLDNLQELHILFPLLTTKASWELYRLPSSLLRFASTVVVFTIGHCDFPNELAPSLNFPLLKHLTLCRVSISQDVFHGLLSVCNVLETLLLQEIHRMSLHISSPTLRSIGFRGCYMGKQEELVIEDTPHLERLLCLGLRCENIRINGAPKLEILGPLSPHNSNIHIGELVFQGLIPTSLNNSIYNVKVLALQFSCTELDAVLDILRFFPCLEKLYVMWYQNLTVQMKNVRPYDPLDPIKCLQTHLKKVVFKNYKGDKQDVSFAKFFVLNAKVLNEIKFGVNKKMKIDKKWVADQHRLLGVGSDASPDAQFKFMCGSSNLNVELDTHDLSIADPFNSLFADGVDALSEETGSCD